MNGREYIMSEPAPLLIDPQIPTLADVLDRSTLVRYLGDIPRGQWNRGPIVEVLGVRVLKHHAGQRCTVEIGLQTEDGCHFLIGKIYHRDRQDVFEAMEKIWQAGFGVQDEFSIPQPVAYLPPLRLLLQEKVEGPIAKEIFKTGDEWSRAAGAEHCALWLARFHALGPKAGPVFDFDCWFKSARERARWIESFGGACAAKSRGLLHWLEETAGALQPVEMRAGHGSYSPAQVILFQGRTCAFDWDGYDVADPARDVARFLAALRRLALGRLRSIRALDGAADVFLKTYLAVGPPDVERNLRFFLVDAHLTLAMYSLFHSGIHREAKAEAMLAEGLRVAEGQAAL
jgi:aminoglycoside phosphotransferase (APT) family kinase protein